MEKLATISETLTEVLRLLRTSNQPQAEQIASVIRNWQKDQANKIN